VLPKGKPNSLIVLQEGDTSNNNAYVCNHGVYEKYIERDNHVLYIYI
jgi:hypothetical protein